MANNVGIVTALKRGRSSSEILQQFNAVNAKILAALLVVALVCYHSILRLTSGSDSCQWLLTNGRFHNDQNWQPYGCMLHQYSSLDANQCFRTTPFHNNIMFVGDSRIRELFRALTTHVNPKAEPLGMSRNEQGVLDKELEIPEEKKTEKAHYDLSFVSSDTNVKISNYWSPMLDASFIDLFKRLSTARNNMPRIIVAGTGTWEIKAAPVLTEKSLKSYKENLRLLSQVLDQWPDNSTKFIWKLQDPVEFSKLSADRKVIQNEVIDAFNSEAVKVLKHTRFQIWSSARLVTESLPEAHQGDGLHINSHSLKYHVQILLNLYCNGLMEFHDGTCCKTAEATTGLQLVTFTVLLLCFVLTVTWLAIQAFRRRRKQRLKMNAIDSQLEEAEEPNKENLEKSALEVNGKQDLQKQGPGGNHAPAKKSEPEWQVLITSLGKLGLIMVYFYICDRTNCFMKENKHYSAMNFWLPVGYVFALGLFFNEKSRSTRVLHRDQTDEWKGWMQLVILIYHMTGASRIVPLYMQIRVLVSSYLFLTGYGHFCYFWNGGSASFVRFCQVLFRMNLMTVVICLCMNRPYQSYYFVPLVTFWYVVVYLTLVLPPQITSALCESKPISYLYIISKFVGLFACITILYMSEVFFENVFLTRPWKALFVTPDDQVHEWWFRWSLDRYSICFGMVFGFLYVCGQKFGFVDDSVTANLWQRGKLAFVAILSVAGISGYTMFTFTCNKKPECNEIHPYIAFVPIISFILLRNAFGAIRVRYSSFFAWFGRISLELFIGQYHIWLAADTHGVLVLIPNYPVLNVIVTSFILVCVAHEIHLITGQLVSVAVPSDWKRTLRNFVIFFLALVPIGIHDGMF